MKASLSAPVTENFTFSVTLSSTLGLSADFTRETPLIAFLSLVNYWGWFISSISIFLTYMDVQLKKSSPKEVQLDINRSDISTLYIVQYEMLKDPTVEFAGVVLRHPLTRQLAMRVNTSKGNPVKEIEKATKTALEYTAELKKAIFSKLKGD